MFRYKNVRSFRGTPYDTKNIMVTIFVVLAFFNHNYDKKNKENG